MGIKYKIKRIKEKILCLLSSQYARTYYSARYVNEIQNCGKPFEAKGEIFISDKRQLVAGAHVSIGKGCHFVSDGGIYIEDGARICDYVKINTLTGNKPFASLSAGEVGMLKPVVIRKGAIVKTGTTVRPGEVIEGSDVKPESSKTRNAADFGSNIFFVVSTGRSGTNAISTFLSKHHDVDCRHEQRYLLNRLSTEYAHGMKTREQVFEELKTMLLQCSTIDTGKRVYGECDLKNTNLIELIAEILPKAKFIWLIRRADEFVSSAFARKWFDEYEYTFPAGKVFSPDNSGDESMFDRYRLEYSRYRVNGHYCGAFSKEEWQQMDCFERNCWYWSYWNNLIEKSFSVISNPTFKVKLEELAEKQGDIFSFLDVQYSRQEVEVTNKAYHAVVKRKGWTPKQQESFQKWCKAGMHKWYGE